MLLSFWLVPGKLEGYPIDNPVGVPEGLGVAVKVVGTGGFAMLLVSMLASVVSIVVRFRRSQGEEREQIKWVAAAAVLFAGIYALPFGSLISDDASLASILFGVLIMAAAVAVSILKYRLYDIDVVISRTLLVAGLAGFITAAYVGIVVGVGSLLGGGGGNPNVVLSVVATTVVAVAFQPVRRWLQRVANRLVFGRRSTPYDVLSGFATRVGAGESSTESLVHVAELLAGGTGADPARVWLRVGSTLRAEATWPVDAGSVDPVTIDVEGDVEAAVSRLPAADLAVPVVERGELLGVLTIAKPRGERVSEVDVDLVERLAAASGVVLRNLRLDAELTQRLVDLEASRRRLVSAQDDARRRIEADLAGGSRAELNLVRERLTSMTAHLDADAAPKTAKLLTQLIEATDGALGTLAGLAAGVYPPRLAADGLVAALTEQAAKAALPVKVRADGVGRYEPDVEAAAYFAVLEGLQNVAKYADATAAQVRLRGDVRLAALRSGRRRCRLRHRHHHDGQRTAGHLRPPRHRRRLPHHHLDTRIRHDHRRPHPHDTPGGQLGRSRTRAGRSHIMTTSTTPDAPVIESRWSLLAWGLATLSLLLGVGAEILGFATGLGFDSRSLFPWSFLVVFGVLGGLIGSRHPRNAIGWIFAGAAVTVGIGSLTGAYADYWVETGVGPELLARIAAVYSYSSWIPWILIPSTFLVLLFPDGHLLSSRWRPFAWSAGCGIVGAFLTESAQAGTSPDYPPLTNPFGVRNELVSLLDGVSLVLVLIGMIGAAASLILRFRRARGQQRQQIKWLAAAGGGGCGHRPGHLCRLRPAG